MGAPQPSDSDASAQFSPFGNGGHRRSGGSFDTRATKAAALIVPGNREERGHMRIVARQGGDGGMEGGKRVTQM